MRRLFVSVSVVLVGCTFPEHQFRDDTDAKPDVAIDAVVLDGALDGAVDSSVDATDAATDSVVDVGSDAPAPTSCTDPSMTSFCAPIVGLVGAYAVDGLGTEYCASGVWSRGFEVKAAMRTTPSPVPAKITERVVVRALLSSYGYHVHVAVLDDPRIVVDTSDYTQGDAVELFLRGAKAATGDLVADQAVHVVVTPPTATSGPNAAYYVGGKKGAGLPGGAFAGRIVAGGWEVEVVLPWTTIKNEPAPGDKIGFDVAVDVKDDPSLSAREVRAIMSYEAVASSPTCSALGTPADPACDDRTWCAPVAYLK